MIKDANRKWKNKNKRNTNQNNQRERLVHKTVTLIMSSKNKKIIRFKQMFNNSVTIWNQLQKVMIMTKVKI